MIFRLKPKLAALALAIGLTGAVSTPDTARAQADPFIGQMMLFAGNFCPRGWTQADGKLLSISSFSAMFSLLGTQFGGDGRTNFAVPDLRGRVPLGDGTGPGLSRVVIGQRGGQELVTLTQNQLPSHNHLVQANNGQNGFADRLGPGNDFLGSPSYNDPTNPAEDIFIYSDQAPNVTMDSRMITNTGGNGAFSIRNPFVGMRWCIATEGIFPSRS
ncbi:MAG: tail fiber protein [Paracoccaceae bacterium]|nr:tail fiber protein [Paracoccaceae bacterium]